MPEFNLNEQEKHALLKLARDTISFELGGVESEDPVATPAMQEHCGAFVTLNSAGALRGCIGHIESDRPLLELVKKMASAAAFDDPRFTPLQEEDLALVELEISVLSPLWEASKWSDFEVGTHGVLLSRGYRQAVFLPQVAPEQGWDTETTLTHLALKAGMNADEWRAEDCRFQLFTAVVFSE
jgi:AmmeMemoRadiSam system protein A